jgi:hypothetical protein
MLLSPRLLAVFALAGLSGCASIVSGTTQQVTVATEPPGADCVVSRGGVPVGSVTSTPGSLIVSRGHIDLDVSCSKPGYASARAVQPTGVEGWLFGNLAIGGLVGIGVDFATGAAYRYDGETELALAALPANHLAAGAPLAPYSYGQTPAYAPSYGSAAPTIIPAATPKGDVTYRWGSGS